MMIPTFLFLFLFLTWSLGVHCDPVDPAPEQDAPYPSPPILPIVYTPVVLSQLCQDPQNYCIYVDQIRPGTVLASPVNATDSQGAFLFRRSDYMERPFHVCYGGCCVDLDFVKRPGCVTMRYVSYPGNGPGHLLARFADNVDNILGPRDDMWRLLEACPPKDEPALPYAVIGARGRHGGRAGKSGKDQQGGPEKQQEGQQGNNGKGQDGYQQQGGPEKQQEGQQGNNGKGQDGYQQQGGPEKQQEGQQGNNGKGQDGYQQQGGPEKQQEGQQGNNGKGQDGYQQQGGPEKQQEGQQGNNGKGQDGYQQQGGPEKQQEGQQGANGGVALVDAGAVSGATPASPPAAAPDAALVDARPNHDYFDDVTVPLADA